MSILIGKHIQAILSGDTTVTRALGNRIYPVGAVKGAPHFPMLVYTNTGINADYTKDGATSENVTVQLVLLHPVYDAAITLMQRIRYLFEDHSAQYPTFEVDDCVLSGYAEDYDLEFDKYVISIILTFNTLDK